MSLTINPDPQSGTLRLEGDFTFESHQAFKAATRDVLESKETTRIVLDLSGLGYLDSSALGMLLVLREKAEAKAIRIVLFKPSPSVMAILTVVKFERLFDIDEG